jgi:hypothetical protein
MLSYAIGGIVLRFVSFALDLNVHRFPSFFTDVYGPFFWLANLLFGFLVARHVRSRSGPWVAIVGAIFMAAILLWDYLTTSHLQYVAQLPGGFWRYEWNQMFTAKCSDSECLGLLFSAPTLALVSYGVGAWVSIRVHAKAKVHVKLTDSMQR